MTIRHLVSAAARTARAADSLSARFARVLAEVLTDTERRLRPIIADAADGSRTAIVRAAQANRTRIQIREALKAAGYDEMADTATGPILDRMADRVLASRRLAKLSADLTPRFSSRLDAIKAIYQLDLLEEGDVAARALWKATVRGIFGSRSVDAILEDLGFVLDRSRAQIQTLYDTSVSIYGRQVEALQAGSDHGTTFAYMGPVDDVMRPFCRLHVGKVYTREQIDALDNGQLNDVFLTGGGYNCRHVWQEVSAFSEAQDLVGTGKRLPEVVDELNLLEAA